MSEKERFLIYCNICKNELAELQEYIHNEETQDENCTLAYIGCNFSYELANVCFELGYGSWFFEYNSKISYKDLKNGVCETIVSDLKIINDLKKSEIRKIKARILQCKENE